jgi:hypothetical protein
MVNVAEVLHAGVSGGNAQHLVIAACFIGHPEHSNGAARNHDTWEGWLLDEYEGVEGITVKTEGVVDKPVVVGIAG